jgi:hypothetical protein
MNRGLMIVSVLVSLIILFAVPSYEINIDSGNTISQPPPIQNAPVLPKEDYIKMASDFVAGKVGEEYFKTHFQVNTIATDQPTKGCVYMVVFDYIIICDDLNATIPVDVFFGASNTIVRERGIPAKDNLMPFRINKTEALKIAEAHKRDGMVYEVTVGIQYPADWAGAAAYRYVWSVGCYLTPRDKPSGNIREFFIDPISGKLLATTIISWETKS